MGVAAQNRGTMAIRRSIEKDHVAVDPATYIIARQEDKIKMLEARVTELETNLAKAKRLITVLSISKHMMYGKLQAMQDICCEVKRSFLASKSYAHAYGMMILANRLGLKQ